MKILVAFLVLTSCAAKPVEKPPEPLAAATPAPAPEPEPDSIAGRVMSDDEVQGVPPNVEVRLLFQHGEVARRKIDETGRFRFEGPLEKGQYELAVHAGALHGTRALTYAGGALTNVTVVIAKSEPHRRRRRHRH
jgi:hypothetical protein